VAFDMATLGLPLNRTVGLLFGRASAELGQLGHPAAFDEVPHGTAAPR
jgi:hypothetical protein